MTISHSLGRPTLLIIGARGFIGTCLARIASEEYGVVAADLAEPGAPGEVRLDLTEDENVRSVFAAVRPGVVALVAAMSDIDACEREPEAAEAVNVSGACRVARESARVGARLVYTSSAAVYDGARHGYREDDPPSPVSVYGRTKARAEAGILAALPSAVIVRPALVLGFSGRAGTNATLNRLADAFRAGRTVTVPDHEFRNPIDVETLCRVLLKLAGAPEARGIYHVGATNSISRFELVRRLAARLGHSDALVAPQREPLPGRAPRGLDHYLLTARVTAQTGMPMPSCDEVLERCLDGTSESGL